MPNPPASHVLPIFAPDWSRVAKSSDKEKRTYVTGELRRLFEGGGAVLLAIMQPGVDDMPRMLALDLLNTNPNEGGRRLYDPARAWRLRLKVGAEPPRLDPQSRRLPPEKLGKVLVAKTGNLGGERGRDQETEESAEWAGPQRAMKAISGRDIYETVEVTFRAEAFTLRDAVLILRRWGIGVQPRQYARSSEWRPGDADEGRGQDRWLVEEVPPGEGATADEEAAPSKKARAT